MCCLLVNLQVSVASTPLWIHPKLRHVGVRMFVCVFEYQSLGASQLSINAPHLRWGCCQHKNEKERLRILSKKAPASSLLALLFLLR
jgi:hypothetical protein